MQKDYDIIIAGMGGAGMLLAWELTQNPSLNLRVLLIDKAEKRSNDRTWSFWAEDGNSLDSAVYRKWHKLAFRSSSYSAELDTAPYVYHTLRSAEFYQQVSQAIKNDKRCTIHYASIKNIEDTGTYVTVETEEHTFKANYVFDSLLSLEKFEQQVEGYNLLWQHFKGWFVKTEEEVFNPEVPTLFDFNIPQEDKVQFVYILPFSTTEALVEYTIFSNEQQFEQLVYNTFLKSYLQKLTSQPYKIEEEEFGIIPMTDAPLPQSNGNRIHYLGTKGGMCKASSGYAFRRMQEDAIEIVKGLTKNNLPKRRKQDPRFMLYDAIILNQMKVNGGAIAEYFSRLFKKHGMEGMLSFLDEKTNFPKELAIMATVPPMPFIISFGRLIKRRFV